MSASSPTCRPRPTRSPGACGSCAWRTAGTPPVQVRVGGKCDSMREVSTSTRFGDPDYCSLAPGADAAVLYLPPGRWRGAGERLRDGRVRLGLELPNRRGLLAKFLRVPARRHGPRADRRHLRGPGMPRIVHAPPTTVPSAIAGSCSSKAGCWSNTTSTPRTTSPPGVARHDPRRCRPGRDAGRRVRDLLSTGRRGVRVPHPRRNHVRRRRGRGPSSPPPARTRTPCSPTGSAPLRPRSRRRRWRRRSSSTSK